MGEIDDHVTLDGETTALQYDEIVVARSGETAQQLDCDRITSLSSHICLCLSTHDCVPCCDYVRYGSQPVPGTETKAEAE